MMRKRRPRKRLVIVILAVLIILAAIALINVYPMLAMKPLNTGLIAETGITAVKNSINNLYFMETEDGYLLIDAGTNPAKVSTEMERLGIAPEHIRHILLTHSDYDHVGSLALFPDAQVYMSEDEAQMIDGTTKRNTTSSNALPEGVDVDKIVWLTDGQSLTLGGHTVRCVKTPGHTPGSMSYWVDEAYLFTGDALRLKGRELLAHPFTMDEAAALQSIDRLRAETADAEVIFTAHYGYLDQ